MKRIKKTTVLLIVVVLMFQLTACGKSTGNSNENPTEKPESLGICVTSVDKENNTLFVQNTNKGIICVDLTFGVKKNEILLDKFQKTEVMLSEGSNALSYNTLVPKEDYDNILLLQVSMVIEEEGKVAYTPDVKMSESYSGNKRQGMIKELGQIYHFTASWDSVINSTFYVSLCTFQETPTLVQFQIEFLGADNQALGKSEIQEIKFREVYEEQSTRIKEFPKETKNIRFLFIHTEEVKDEDSTIVKPLYSRCRTFGEVGKYNILINMYYPVFKVYNLSEYAVNETFKISLFDKERNKILDKEILVTVEPYGMNYISTNIDDEQEGILRDGGFFVCVQ